jgi:hypothetical protein
LRGIVGFAAVLATGGFGATTMAASASHAAPAARAVVATTLSGHVKGAPAGTSVDLIASNNQSGTGGPVNAHGYFTLRQLGKGYWHLTVNLPSGYVVKSASPGRGADRGTKIDGRARHHGIHDIKVLVGGKGKDYNFTVVRG